MVTFLNSPRRVSSSERPVRFNMASLLVLWYGSCSGMDSRISATSSTIEGGSAGEFSGLRGNFSLDENGFELYELHFYIAFVERWVLCE